MCSEQNLEPEDPDVRIRHPGIEEYFEGKQDGVYKPRQKLN